MPVATAPARVGRALSPARPPDRSPPPLKVVEPPRPRRRAPRGRRIAVLSIALVVGSLLMVTGADAYLTQGQVRLTRLQQQLGTEFSRHRDLEQQVAELSNPSAVVSAAQQHGFQAPGQVIDLSPAAPMSPSGGDTGPPTVPNASPSGQR